MSRPLPDSFYAKNDEEEYLTRIVVDEALLKFYLYSSYGEKQVVDCDNTDEYDTVLDLIKCVVNEDIVVYAEPPAEL
jgi:hypothetical protein